MGFLILLIGAFVIAAVYKGTTPTLGALLAQDVPGFATWAMALVIIGGFGFIPKLRPVSTAMLVLVFVAMILKNGGIFTQLQNLLAHGIPNVAPTAAGGAYPYSTPGAQPSSAFNPGSNWSTGSITTNIPFSGYGTPGIGGLP